MDFKKMDTKALNRKLLDLIQELERAGLVDHYFRQCHSLKEDSVPSFFLDLIRVFLSDVYTALREMEKALKQPVVTTFGDMDLHCIKLKGSSACFGACRIRDACTNLRKAIDKNSREECIHAVNDVEHEYTILYDELQSIMEVEKELVSRETRQAVNEYRVR